MKLRMDRLWSRVNKDIFNGELDKPIFALHYDPSMYGYHTVWGGQHIISLQAEMKYFRNATTMAHEMIHQWQYDNGLKRNHGKQFKKMAKKIARYYRIKDKAIV